MPEDSDHKTADVDVRFPYTNDLLAGALTAFLIGLTSWFAYTTGEVPLWLSTSATLAVLTAIAWVFGKGAFKAAYDAVSDAD